MHICENCNNEHDGSYASGRFCSETCARGFSTKSKRKEINKKVSESLSRRGNNDIERICPECGNIFIVPWYKRHIKTCSRICGTSLKFKTNPGLKKIFSAARIKNIENGIVNGSGIKCEFKFNDKIIKCDSKLEYACLLYFVENYKVLDINRANIKIEYEYKGASHIFLPDFKIHTIDGIFIVECKSDKLASYTQKKWIGYIETSKIKKETLEKYCKDNNFISFWFTQNTSNKYASVSVIGSGPDS